MLPGVSLRLKLRGGNINFAPFYQSYSEAKDKEHNLRYHFNENFAPWNKPYIEVERREHKFCSLISTLK